MSSRNRPCHLRFVSSDDGGVKVDLTVPGAEKDMTFTMTVERDNDGDWRVYLPAWPEEEVFDDPVVAVPWDNGFIEVCNGIVYVAAPES